MTQAQQLPSISALPTGDARFLAAARDIVLLSEGVMALCDSPLLSLAVPSDRWGEDEPLMLWCQRLMPCAGRRERAMGTPFMQPALDALCLAADVLFDRLEQWGWEGAAEAGLGVVTDGSGVALTLRQPTLDQGPGWLLDLADERTGAIEILPLCEHGIWGLLSAEGRGRLH